MQSEWVQTNAKQIAKRSLRGACGRVWALSQVGGARTRNIVQPLEMVVQARIVHSVIALIRKVMHHI